MQQFSWPEVQAYWRDHVSRRAPLAPGTDPQALGNVCTPGAPPFLNEYFAANQARVFRRLLDLVPRPVETERALDVGCGAARWSVRLAERGYAVTGVDLQPELIEYDRSRFPFIEFRHMAAQELPADGLFSLVASVTVLAHNPPEEQERLVAHLSRLLAPGGHALVLENVRDRDLHVFANSAGAWRALFERHGFELVREVPYDFNPCLRLLGHLARRRRAPARTAPDAHMTSGAHVAPALARRGKRATQRVAVAVDRRVERLAERAQVPARGTHSGFLFRLSG